jgi:predicted DNA-binding transcriptional regulator AlpA
VWAIKQAYDQFKTAFLAELGTFPSYFVTQKGDRDTLTLLDQPWRMFPDDLLAKVPEASYDVAEAGKALCFEVATACGYHVFRATEAVLRRYYSHVTGGKAHPKMRNISVYVRAIRDAKCGDERILSVIEQMSKLHRNPIAHPEVALTLDEAISVLGMARSVITAMLSALPFPPQTTTAAGVIGATGATGPN